MNDELIAELVFGCVRALMRALAVQSHSTALLLSQQVVCIRIVVLSNLHAMATTYTTATVTSTELTEHRPHRPSTDAFYTACYVGVNCVMDSSESDWWVFRLG